MARYGFIFQYGEIHENQSLSRVFSGHRVAMMVTI